ncbi:hypothetical protein F4778DRAFT_360508 [Xylariomycetidae sp. FL2044]|nr:hypothetical protein F4778DRAFT_360508 [Xylariomycetidae sp. FL2044]
MRSTIIRRLRTAPSVLLRTPPNASIISHPFLLPYSTSTSSNDEPVEEAPHPPPPPAATPRKRRGRPKKAPEEPQPQYPDPPTAQHRDLATYLAYAARTGLDTSSRTYVGTHYEYAVAAALTPLGFELRRVGGAGDNGIDLLGRWRVPSSLGPLPVLLQCKYAGERTGVRPSAVRELEGAFVGAPPGWRRSSSSSRESGRGCLAFLVAHKPATRGILAALGRSEWPLGFVCCSSGGRVEQMLWNRRADDEGLLGMGVAVHRAAAGDEDGGQRLVLTYQGKPCNLAAAAAAAASGSREVVDEVPGEAVS